MQKAPLAATYRLKKGYLWCADKKQWISPKVRVPKGMVGAPAFLVVQKSPSGIATCRICGKLIARNEYRFAWPMTDPRGQYGAISAWLHSECSNVLIPQMFQKWQKLEKQGWPEYELNEDQPSERGGQDEASARVKQEGEPAEDAAEVNDGAIIVHDDCKELKKEVNEGGVVLVSEDNVDCASSMTLELWLEIYCAHWSELTAADADLKTKLLSHIQMPINNGVDENENLTGSHHIVCQLTPIEKVPGMECNLLQFQKEGIAWMVHQESNVRTFGGILADEMGMGKTIQTIGCILYNRVYGTGHAKRENSMEWLYPAAHPLSEVNAQRRAHQEELKNKLDQEEAEELEESRIKKEAAAAAAAIELPVANAQEISPVQAKGKARVARPKPSPKKKSAPPSRLTEKERMEIAAAKKSALSTSDKCRIDEAPDVQTEGATLVIAPLAAVLQWQSELNKFASELNVLIYHGPNRQLLTEELERADVVITTYPTIEADYRAVISKHKLKCPYCSKMFLPSKLRLHLRDMCGPDAVRTAKQALRERKQETTKAKAMESLHIGTSTVPTVSNIYREIMHTAGRDKEAADFSGAAWLRPIRRRKITNDDDSGGEVDEEEASAEPENTRLEEGTHNQAAPSSSSSSSRSAELSDDDWLNTTHWFKDASGRSADDTDEDDIESARRREFDGKFNGTPRVVTRHHQELRATPPDSSKMREVDEPICSMKEIEGEQAMPVASTAQTSLKTEHASTAPAIVKTDCDDQPAPNQSQSAPQLTPVKNQSSTKRRGVKSQTGAASSARLISAPPASPLIVPSPANYGQWAETATESQIRRSRVDTLKAVLGNLNLSPSQGDGLNPIRKADLVQRLLDWRAEINKGSTVACSVTKKSRPNPKNEDARITSPPRLQPPPPAAAAAAAEASSKKSRSSSPASSSLDDEEDDTESSSSELDSSSSSGVPLPTTTSSDESLSDIVVPDVSSPSPEDSSVSSYAESDVSSPGPSKGNYFARFGSMKGGKKGAGKKGGKKGVGKKSQGQKSTISQASSLASDGASSVDMNFIDLSSSPLHSLKWNRIVLDEAHRIKSHTTNTCKSVFALKSCGTRWCLTGTPLQNRIHELYSLLRFLQFFPYAYYFCSKKNCACSTLNYSFEGGSYCVTCGHTKMNHFSYFNRKIAKPIISYGVHGEGGLALEILRRDVLSMVLLRRTKVERAADVNLPPLDVFIRREELSQPEMDFYESLYKQSKTKFDTYTLAGTILHNFAHVFDLLSRLRQAVDHPYMIIHGSLATDSQIPSNSHSSNEICGICQEDIERTNYYRSSCDHHFDVTCLDEYVLEAPSDTKLGCPVCYQSLTYTLFNKITNKPVIRGEEEDSSSPITLDDDNLRSNSGLPAAQQALSRQKSNIMSRINPREFQTSTKIEVLLQEIQNSEADSKAIVFSQFTSFLYLIDFKLKKSGFKCAVFTGSLSMESRQNIIMNFNTDPDLKVILISLKAGGEGLNLQIANQIYLMDPWWNPAAEMQAIQRAHRIGQTKHVRAVRIIAKNTIEERILQLQERKQLVFDGTVNNSNQAFQKLSADDLKFLFQ